MRLRGNATGSRRRAQRVGSSTTSRAGVQAALDVLAWAIALAAAESVQTSRPVWIHEVAT
jgi:hypothetical protein